MEYKLHTIDDPIRKQVVDFITIQWGSPKIVSRGHVHLMDQLPGIIAMKDKEIVGLLTYHIVNDECEIVTLDSLEENKGLGSQLIHEMEKIAIQEKCKRLWLITTNDNTRAIRFYQKRGYDLKALHRHAVDEARKLKPAIPFRGYDDIPIQHELEFEKNLIQ
ncbi:GNAT family N-acetyltransferase [Caldalkalibacillus mannanilyticus]|uniref:GNAT family N-acetyltransferase n=1 Tax=Caldalkalibacillus mannanilyticus TaxID=1418 RepID=UPI0004683672|nr:GNAT family N-acetyltransferase [Caldalkalibacillus mannanilyticus]